MPASMIKSRSLPPRLKRQLQYAKYQPVSRNIFKGRGAVPPPLQRYTGTSSEFLQNRRAEEWIAERVPYWTDAKYTRPRNKEE